MACSEARIAANRANALKSTGPRTEEGKAASRRNALKHGLAGAGVVLHGEDAAEVAALSGPLVRELAGPDGSPTARLLAERVATLIVRLKRSARHEFAAARDRCLDAALAFDEVRAEEAARLFGAIAEGSNREVLLLMPEGVDLLDAALADLRLVAAAGDPAAWSQADSARLVRCLPPEARPHAEALGRALVDGDLSGIDRGIVALMDPAKVRGPWALDQVVGLIDAERADLEALRPTLDAGAIERARAEAVNLALVGSDPDALRARRYESATERALYRALREIREARNAAPAPPPAPAEPAPAPRPPAPSPLEVIQAIEAARLRHAQSATADAPPAPPVAPFFPKNAGTPAPGHASTRNDADPAPRGRSRYEDRRDRPRLDR